MKAVGWLEWTWISAAPALLAVLFFRRLRARRRRRRERAARMQRPFDLEEERLLDRDFPRWRHLPPQWWQRHAGLTRVLMEEKNFEACGDLSEVSPEMRLLIAAQAVLLILGQDSREPFPGLRSILVYPGRFRDPGRRRFGLSETSRGYHYGESWESGSVVLSWENVLAGARGEDDGMNVVLHEFAHQLDHDNGLSDGLPQLRSSREYPRWKEVMERHYEELVEASRIDENAPFLDPYGATHPSEFFAVVAETFFEDPADLKTEHPELYDLLADYFGLDPASWEGFGRTRQGGPESPGPESQPGADPAG